MPASGAAPMACCATAATSSGSRWEASRRRRGWFHDADERARPEDPAPRILRQGTRPLRPAAEQRLECDRRAVRVAPGALRERGRPRRRASRSGHTAGARGQLNRRPPHRPNGLSLGSRCAQAEDVAPNVGDLLVGQREVRHDRVRSAQKGTDRHGRRGRHGCDRREAGDGVAGRFPRLRADPVAVAAPSRGEPLPFGCVSISLRLPGHRREQGQQNQNRNWDETTTYPGLAETRRELLGPAHG